jgi:acetoin utilization deacetylase AcuC-like enzyme
MLLFSHDECLRHEMQPGHPERPDRLRAVLRQLRVSGLLQELEQRSARPVALEQLQGIHAAEYLQRLERTSPQLGLFPVDPDTAMGPHSLSAAAHAAGAVVDAVTAVLAGEAKRAFCAVRPPGHHAERHRAMGFCLFNNVAVGALHALAAHGVDRVAIVDFDVHHGNGTEEIFADESRVLFCSTFQHPFYPFTELRENTANRISVPLEAGAGSRQFRAAVSEHWLPALNAFEPEMVLVSAGFDAHVDDDMSQVSLTDADYQWVTEKIVDVANASASGRIVSVLEGGYELRSLARCVDAHVRVLMDQGWVQTSTA